MEKCYYTQLEAVTKRELHFAGRTRGRGDLSEGSARDPDSRQAEAIVVEEIERLPPNLKILGLRPRHLESLQERGVEVPEAWSTQDVSSADFTVVRESKHACRRIGRIEHHRGISKELNRPVGSIVNTFLKRASVCAIVSGRAVEVEAYREGRGGRAERQSTASSEDAGHFPTADDLVDETRGTAAETLSATERQLVNEVCIDEVTNVEVRVSTANAEIGHVANQTARDRIHHTRSVVDRMRPGVVEVKLQTL